MEILVTGGTKGLGVEIAKALAAPGADVFLNYHSDVEAAASAEREISSLGATCHLLETDAGTPKGCAEISAFVAARTDRLDQVVHYAYASPALTADPKRFTQAAVINGMSLLFLTQAVLPLLSRGSTIFFLTSRGAGSWSKTMPPPGLARRCRKRWCAISPWNWRPAAPASTASRSRSSKPMQYARCFGNNVGKLMEHAAASNPSGRAIRSADYTGIMKFLASPEAEVVTGQIVFVNGGANLSA